MSFDLARVAAVHPEDHSVDLVMFADGARVAGVQVISGSASRNTGSNDLVAPADPASGDKWDLTQATERDIIAVVGYVGKMPMVFGFLFPQVCQMLFDLKDFSVRRHASDVYHTVDKDGNVEFYHPSGTYFRIASSAAHADLTGLDFDKKWKIDKNTESSVHVHLEVKAAGALKAMLDIDPEGNVALTHVGDLAIDTSGDAAITAGGSMTLTASGVNIASGSLTHNGTNVGDSHVHSDPQGGDTGAPH